MAIHLANTDFEFELERKKPLPLRSSIEQNPILCQLQFLPFLMAPPEDTVIVTDTPEEWEALPFPTPKLMTMDDRLPPDSAAPLEIWGSSDAVARWAEKRNLTYSHPPLEVVREVHSKIFSYSHTPKLAGSTLLSDAKERDEWLSATTSRVVLKTAFGVSANGHLIFDPQSLPPSLGSFCEREWGQGRQIIAEPWVERQADFSSQWEISPSGALTHLGTTALINNNHGGYLGTQTGPLPEAVQRHHAAHLEYAEGILVRTAAKGFYGPIGVDAMVYGKDQLHPVVELNARKTMSRVALDLQALHYPDKVVRISYTKKEKGRPGLLPSSLAGRSFSRQLYLSLSS